MKDQEIMYDEITGVMFNSSVEKIKEAAKKINIMHDFLSLDDLTKDLKKEEEDYQIWKRGIAKLYEMMGLYCHIDGDIMYTTPLMEYRGVGTDLRKVFFRA